MCVGGEIDCSTGALSFSIEHSMSDITASKSSVFGASGVATC